MATVSFQIASLLEKMTSTDKEDRVKAANDLLSELQKDSIKLDEESEGRVVRMLLKLLEDKNGEVQKAAVECIAALISKVKDSSKMLGLLIKKLETALHGNNNNNSANTYIQALATVCKSGGGGGGRFVEYLDTVCKILLRASGDDELKENVLQAFEIFITRCPAEMTTLNHFEPILALCTTLIAHDPNYNEGSEEGVATADGEEGAVKGADMSWKVRRSAAKCIESIITSRPDLLLYIYQNVSNILIQRFREREETVRRDDFSAYRSMLRITKPVVQSLQDAKTTGLSADKAAVVVGALEGQIPSLVKILQKQLKEKNMRTRQVALSLVSDLIQVLPGSLAPYLLSLIPGIQLCLSQTSSTSHLRTSTLQFLYCILATHPPSALQPHIESILPSLLSCASDRNYEHYEVTAEALNTLQMLIKVVGNHPNSASIATRIYPVVLECLRTTGIDQKVKGSSITTLGVLFSHAGHLEWKVLSEIIQELPPFLAVSDLHTAQQTLLLMTTINKKQPHALEETSRVTMGNIKALVRSPLMKGAALTALLDYLGSLVTANTINFNPNKLLEIFLEQESSYDKQSYYNLAKCIAVISCGGGEGLNVAGRFVEDLQNGSRSAVAGQQQQQQENNAFVVIRLLSVGEIGRRVDLIHLPNLRETILLFFQHNSEEVKTAASYAYGSLAIGNLEGFLPVLLEELKTSPEKQYLLLHALKEIISADVETPLLTTHHTRQVWSTLYKLNFKSDSTPTKNIVKDCLGELALATQPGGVHNHFHEGVESIFVGPSLTEILKLIDRATCRCRELPLLQELLRELQVANGTTTGSPATATATKVALAEEGRGQELQQQDVARAAPATRGRGGHGANSSRRGRGAQEPQPEVVTRSGRQIRKPGRFREPPAPPLDTPQMQQQPPYDQTAGRTHSPDHHHQNAGRPDI